MESYFGEIFLVRFVLQRAIAALYLIAFIAVLRQFPALLGENGLEPTPSFLKTVRFRTAPSVFHWHYSDRFLKLIAWTGISVSGIALLGGLDRCPVWLSVPIWLLLWGLYLSVVNVGQTFYSFGRESMLLEAGFYTAFLDELDEPSIIPVLILRWMLFRTE